MKLDMTGIASNVIAMLIFVAITSAARYGWSRLNRQARTSDAVEIKPITRSSRQDWQRTVIGAMVSGFCFMQVRDFATSAEPITRADVATVAMWAGFFAAFALATLFRPEDK